MGVTSSDNQGRSLANEGNRNHISEPQAPGGAKEDQIVQRGTDGGVRERRRYQRSPGVHRRLFRGSRLGSDKEINTASDGHFLIVHIDKKLVPGVVQNEVFR